MKTTYLLLAAAAFSAALFLSNPVGAQPLQPEVLFSFPSGQRPNRNLIQGRDGNFYGTTFNGGASGNGEIFRLRRAAFIQSLGMVTNGFQLNYVNVGGSGTVVLEASPDLRVWTPIQTNGPVAARRFLDPSARAQARQFYRAVQQ